MFSQLQSSGYSVTSKDASPIQGLVDDLTDSSVSQIIYLSKTTGSNRQDINGGWVYLTDKGVSFDVFKGGNNYGEHLRSSDDAFVLHPVEASVAEELITNFLNWLSLETEQSVSSLL